MREPDRAQWMWHAIAASDAGWNALQGTSDILIQKNLLFQLALDKWLDPSLDAAGMESWKLSPAFVKERLFWLGVFFHYQQDTWSHRRPAASPTSVASPRSGQKSRRWNNLRWDFPQGRPESGAQSVFINFEITSKHD
jgi:hypothetical protein